MSADAAPHLDRLIIPSLLNRYFAGVALTLCAYDWLILIERESQTAWKFRWTRTKAIYYINRVITIVGLTVTVIQYTDLWTVPLSQRFYACFTPMLQLVSISLSNVILTLRVIALYNRHILIKRILYTILILNWLVGFISQVHSNYLWSLGAIYVPSLHRCIWTTYSPSSPVVPIVATTFEVTLFAFTLYRAIFDYRNGVITGYPKSRFLFILYRDGFYYFAALGMFHGWNAFQLLLAPKSGLLLTIYITWAMNTVMSSRVYLNLTLATLAAHGGEGTMDGVTTGGFSSLPVDWAANHSDETEMELGRTETFGAKRVNCGAPITTFTTTILTAESNTHPDAKPDSAA